jgi:hypothetical protein
MRFSLRERHLLDCCNGTLTGLDGAIESDTLGTIQLRWRAGVPGG